MNYRLYALLLPLTLAFSPALQAMRLRNAVITTARSLSRQPLYQPDRQAALARTHATYNNEYGYSQEESHYTHNTSHHIPAAAIAIGLGLTAQQAMEEQDDSLVINKLDIYDINAVLEVFKNGTEDEKQELAQRIAQKITYYKIEDIIKILQLTKNRPHRTIVNAIAKNITHFAVQQITQILEGDTQDETHDLIASALNKTYNYFTGYSFGGHKLYTTQEGIYQYAETVNCLRVEYQSKAIQPLARYLATIKRWQVFRLLQSSPEKSKQVVISALVENCKDDIKNIDTMYSAAYDLRNLTKESNTHNQKLITAIVIQNLDKFDNWGLAQILETANMHTQEVIIKAIVENMSTYHSNSEIKRTNELYDGYSLSRILKASNPQNQEVITNAIISNITHYDGYDLSYFIESSNEQNKAQLITAIAQNISKYTDYELLGILYATKGKSLDITKAIVQNLDNYNNALVLNKILELSNEQNREFIIQTIIAKIDVYIDQNSIDSQSAAHLKNNVAAAWQYIKTIANNPKYKMAVQQAISHEHSISSDSAVFYHSQRSPVYWLELLYTKLWEQKYNQKSTNYLFTRFPDDVSEFANAVLQLDGHQKKAILLKEGRKDELRPYLFFANYALFGNANNWGSCSIHYFLQDFNVGDPDITTQTIIDKFGDQTILDKYKAELEQLEREFKEIVPNSVLLQLAIPHKALNEHVYLAAPYGYKKKLKISDEEIDDVNTIVTTLKTNPKAFDETDQHEFCVVMTPDTVHALREQGAEIRVYGDFDQEKLNALTHKLEALIARIAQENPKTFSATLTPTQSYQAYKPILDNLLQKRD